MWASTENPMKAFLYKTTTDSLKDLSRKVAMVRAKGTLDFAKDVSQAITPLLTLHKHFSS